MFTRVTCVESSEGCPAEENDGVLSSSHSVADDSNTGATLTRVKVFKNENMFKYQNISHKW